MSILKRHSFWLPICLVCLALCAHSSRAHDSNATDNDQDHHHHAHCHFGRCGRPAPLTNYKVWLAGSASIFIVSLCGIFGVLVIPIMHRIFYQHLIQFLVALAVGTLFGDAVLHLLPHALQAGLDLDEHQVEAFEQLAAWKGFFILAAFVVFFLLERIINMTGEWRERRQRAKADHPEKKVNIVRSGHKTSDKAVGERLCKHKYSAYCVSDIENPQNGHQVSREAENNGAGKEGEAMLDEDNASSDSAVAPPQWKIVPKGSDGHADPDNVIDTALETVYIRDHETMHHGHSHAHSHLHSKPSSISSVAWMVIFGDGIHNLADGLAIGVAFTESYVAGIATSIAILCHELPHEIGDFAMLLKTGMSVRQAVFYNLISSVLAFIGMMVGIFLGNVESWTSWIFCATAGIFIYIALVDMIPELNSGHAHPYSSHEQKDSHLLELGLHLLGMSLGIAIMMLIALYEHDLKDAFGSESSH